MWRHFSFLGSCKAQASPWPWGELCHLLPFLYRSSLCQPARASTDLSGEKQAELRRAVEQLGRTAWSGAREMLVSGTRAPGLTQRQCCSCLLALPAPAPGTAITMARYTRHCWLLLQGARAIVKLLFQTDWLENFSLSIFVILINFKTRIMNGGSNRKRNRKMFI